MLNKLVRIGKDAELKTLPSGNVVLEINAVYDIGFGDKKESQWIRLVMFGQRAEKLVSHFTKGKQIVVYAEDVKARAYAKGDGSPACSLEAKLVSFDFVSGQQQTQQPAMQHQPAQQPQSQPQQAKPQYNEPNNPIDFDDDIPF